MHLMAYDYYAGKPNDAVGLVRTASLIRQARTESQEQGFPVLLLDNGDLLQGTPLADYLALQPGPNPLIAAMHDLGYDAATLGNHDFNYGLDYLDAVIKDAEFPVCCSNVTRKGKAVWPATVVLHRDCTDQHGEMRRLNVGLLGLVPPQILRWDRRHLAGKVTVSDIVACGVETAHRLRSEGADLVVALAHTGIGPFQGKPNLENAALALAQASDVDTLIAGHTHQRLPGPDHAGKRGVDEVQGLLHGKPAVMPGADGNNLGVIDLFLEHEDNRWQVVDHNVELRPIARRDTRGRLHALVPDDDRLATILAPVHAAAVHHVGQPVGRTDVPLHTYFATLRESAALRFVAQAQAAAVQVALAGGSYEKFPLLSAVTPFKCGGRAGPDNYTDVQAGDVLLRNVADLHMFPNELTAILVSGQTVSNWLEMTAGAFHRIHRGKSSPQLLRNEEFPAYIFDVLYGLNYTIDPLGPARFGTNGILRDPKAKRIRGLRWNNAPVDSDQMFVVAVNNYRAAGGGGYFGLEDAHVVYEHREPVRDCIARYLRHPTAPQWSEASPWALASLDATRVLFETGPGARRHLAELANFQPAELGMTDQGFLRLELTL